MITLGTEHLLLGLLDEGVASHLQEHLDVDPVKVRAEIAWIIVCGPERLSGPPECLPWTRTAWRALEQVCAVAHGCLAAIGPEHLLPGVLDEEEGVAFQAVVNLVVAPALLREQLRQLLV
jgi:hypothetical protein